MLEIPQGSPPPPHDPSERVVVDVAFDWQVRAFRPDDARFSYFVPRGLFHVQLWHAIARVSVLTPSRLTRDAFEIFPVLGWKSRAMSWVAAAKLIRVHHGVRPPSDERVAAIRRWFVDGIVRRCAEHSCA